MNPQSPNDPPSVAAPPKSRPPGRPRKLDEIKRREICALISAGCGIKDAADYVGCVASTIKREGARNRQFNEHLRRAFMAAELNPLHAIRSAAAKHWRAAAWMLERINPERFVKRNPLFITPDQLESCLKIAVDMMNQEVNDPEIQDRMTRRLDELIHHTKEECRTINNPYSDPTNKRKTRKRRRPTHHPNWPALAGPTSPPAPPYHANPMLESQTAPQNEDQRRTNQED